MTKIHPTAVELGDRVFSVEEVAQAVGALRYDQTARFLKFLTQEFYHQAHTDERKRWQLAGKLRDFAEAADCLADYMWDIFDFCAPHMEDELQGDKLYQERMARLKLLCAPPMTVEIGSQEDFLACFGGPMAETGYGLEATMRYLQTATNDPDEER